VTRIQGVVAAIVTLLLSVGGCSTQTQPAIGLITKTDTNLFFVKMREGAQAAASSEGVRLLTGAGKADGDNAGQITAIENMVAAGARAILITPNDKIELCRSSRWMNANRFRGAILFSSPLAV
jgi:fructose transport system substrate-binding protein